MEDIVVIILTLIVVIIGAVGSIKRKNLQQPAENQSQKPNNIWDFLDNLNQEPVPKNQEFIEEPVVITEKQEITRTSYTFSAQEEGKPNLIDNTLGKKDNLNISKPQVKIKDKRFSLREAVIYSEILNRKYTE